MKVALRYRNSNPVHTYTDVFIDGVLVGTLCLLTQDVTSFQLVLLRGLSLPEDQFKMSGKVYDNAAEVKTGSRQENSRLYLRSPSNIRLIGQEKRRKRWKKQLGA